MNIDTTEAVCMTQDRNSSVVLDVVDQLIGATWYHDVDVLVKVKERGYGVSHGDELYRGVRDACVG